VEARSKRGGQEYAGRSWSRDPRALVDEIREELADVCAWAGILDHRLQVVGEQIASLHDAPTSLDIQWLEYAANDAVQRLDESMNVMPFWQRCDLEQVRDQLGSLAQKLRARGTVDNRRYVNSTPGGDSDV